MKGHESERIPRCAWGGLTHRRDRRDRPAALSLSLSLFLTRTTVCPAVSSKMSRGAPAGVSAGRASSPSTTGVGVGVEGAAGGAVVAAGAAVVRAGAAVVGGGTVSWARMWRARVTRARRRKWARRRGRMVCA